MRISDWSSDVCSSDLASLVSFLVGEGGIIDAGGELRGMDAGTVRPGLVNSSGMDLDRARELAAEAGYFGDDTGESIGTTTTADLMDRIDSDLRSGDAFSAAQGAGSRPAFQEGGDQGRKSVGGGKG